MTAKVLTHIEKFAGKSYQPGDVITDEDLGKATRQSIESLVNLGIIEAEGFGTAKGGMSNEDREKIDRLQASVEKLTETVNALPGQLLEAIKLGAVATPAKATKAKKPAPPKAQT